MATNSYSHTPNLPPLSAGTRRAALALEAIAEDLVWRADSYRKVHFSDEATVLALAWLALALVPLSSTSNMV